MRSLRLLSWLSSDDNEYMKIHIFELQKIIIIIIIIIMNIIISSLKRVYVELTE